MVTPVTPKNYIFLYKENVNEMQKFLCTNFTKNIYMCFQKLGVTCNRILKALIQASLRVQKRLHLNFELGVTKEKEGFG